MPANIVLSNPSGMAAPAGHYSHAIKANGFVFVSGQLPIKPDGTRLADASFEVQARQVLANVGAALSSAGSSVEHLVQVRAYLTDMAIGRCSTQFTPNGPAPSDRPAAPCRCQLCIMGSESKSRR